MSCISVELNVKTLHFCSFFFTVSNFFQVLVLDLCFVLKVITMTDPPVLKLGPASKKSSQFSQVLPNAELLRQKFIIELELSIPFSFVKFIRTFR